MKKLVALIGAFFVLCTPALAIDRVTWYAGIQPPSQWLLQESRFVRLGFGAYLQHAFGANLPTYANLTVSPVPGTLTVQIGPSAAGQVGSIYLQTPDDQNPWGTSPIGGLGNLALGSDATSIVTQGNVTTTTTVPGTVPVPSTAGQSQITMVECTTTITDQTSQSVNFSNALGILSQQTVNRDRVDLVSCQLKSGAASTTPVAPTVDAGYVSVALVTVPQGTTAITVGMIAASTSLFGGFVQPGGTPTFATVKLTNLANNQCVTTNGTGQLVSTGATCGSGSGTVTGVAATAPITSSGGSAPTIACATCAVTNASNTFSGDQSFLGAVASQSVLTSGYFGNPPPRPTVFSGSSSQLSWNGTGGGGEASLSTGYNGSTTLSLWHWNGLVMAKSSQVQSDGSYQMTGSTAYVSNSAHTYPYDAAVGANSTTEHIERGTISIAANTSGTFTFVTAYSNTTSFQCSLGSATLNNYIASRTTSSITIQNANTSGGTSVDVICVGN